MADHPQSVDSELFSAIIVEMVRRGVIPADVLEHIERSYDAEAEHTDSPDREERYRLIAALAMELRLRAIDQQPSEFRAEQRRERFRLVDPE